MAAKRTDYRTEEGTLRSYLIHEYPKGLDFNQPLRGSFSQLHDTRRDHDGRYLGTDETGYLELEPRFFNELAGVDRVRFADAIDRAKDVKGCSPDGTTLMSVLKWHQLKYKASRYVLASDLGVDERTITNWLSKAVAMVRENLDDDARLVVEKLETKRQHLNNEAA